MAAIRAASRLGNPNWLSTGLVVVTGDSRAEAFTAPFLGNIQAVQYGFAGITTGDLTQFIPGASVYQPSHMVLNVGVNDALFDPNSPQELNYERDFIALIAACKATMSAGSNLVVTTPLGYEMVFGSNPVNVVQRSQRTRQIAQIQLAVCQAFNVRCVDINGNSSFSNSDTTAKTGLTIDGVHFSKAMWQFWLGLVNPQII
jgi:lysophospholipase L1-like esterase